MPNRLMNILHVPFVAIEWNIISSQPNAPKPSEIVVPKMDLMYYKICHVLNKQSHILRMWVTYLSQFLKIRIKLAGHQEFLIYFIWQTNYKSALKHLFYDVSFDPVKTIVENKNIAQPRTSSIQTLHDTWAYLLFLKTIYQIMSLHVLWYIRSWQFANALPAQKSSTQSYTIYNHRKPCLEWDMKKGHKIRGWTQFGIVYSPISVDRNNES